MSENSSEILNELRQIKFWMKLANFQEAHRIINVNLETKEDILIYHLSDGKRSTREIVSELKKEGISVTHPTIANTWKRWLLVGLVEPSSYYKGRFRKAVSLEELGIEAPGGKESSDQ